MSVEFKAKHRQLLEKTLAELGLSFIVNGSEISVEGRCIVIDTNAGKATVQYGQQDKLNQIKQRYSSNAIRLAARKHGWNVQATKQNAGIIRR
jgi:hypothetical protein